MDPCPSIHPGSLARIPAQCQTVLHTFIFHAPASRGIELGVFKEVRIITAGVLHRADRTAH